MGGTSEWLVHGRSWWCSEHLGGLWWVRGRWQCCGCRRSVYGRHRRWRQRGSEWRVWGSRWRGGLCVCDQWGQPVVRVRVHCCPVRGSFLRRCVGGAGHGDGRDGCWGQWLGELDEWVCYCWLCRGRERGGGQQCRSRRVAVFEWRCESICDHRWWQRECGWRWLEGHRCRRVDDGDKWKQLFVWVRCGGCELQQCRVVRCFRDDVTEHWHVGVGQQRLDICDEWIVDGGPQWVHQCHCG